MKHLIWSVLPLLLTASCRAQDPAAPIAVETPPPAFEVVALQYAVAGELAQTLGDLVASASEGGDANVQIASDGRTNSLLVSAPPELMEQIRALVVRLDVEQ